MICLNIALLAILFASASAISCNVGSGTGGCFAMDFGAIVDTCFQCTSHYGLSMSSGCIAAATCDSVRSACEAEGRYTQCQTANCNSCDASSDSVNATISIPPFILSVSDSLSLFNPQTTFLCFSQPSWAQSADLNPLGQAPFPFGNDPSVMSVLIWDFQNIFAFSLPNCSGIPRLPSQIARNVRRSKTSTTFCFSEQNPQILPSMGSVTFMNQPNIHPLLAFVLSILRMSPVWGVESFSNSGCIEPPPPPQLPDYNQVIYLIGILSDYVIPLLALASSCRWLLFQPAESRLTMPCFAHLWISRSSLHDRCAAWFLTSTLNDFVIMLFNNYTAIDVKAPLFNWFSLFPVALAIRPVLVCLLFSQPNRIIASVSVIEGCLLTCNSLLRLQTLPTWMILPRMVAIVPAVMFTITSALNFILPAPLEIDPKGSTFKNLAVRTFNAVFGVGSSTFKFHNARVVTLVSAMRKAHIDVKSKESQARLIGTPAPKSARMLAIVYLAFFWQFFFLSFVYSALWQLLLTVFAYSTSTIKTIMITCSFIFSLLLLYTTVILFFNVNQKYRQQYLKFSELCRKGFIPPIIQSSVSFQSAAKYMASETIRILWDSFFGVIESLKPALCFIIIVFLILVAQFVLKIPIFNVIARLLAEGFLKKVGETFELLTRPEVLSALLILLLSGLFSSSWISPFRLFRTELLRAELPMRVANCCCLQLRTVHASVTLRHPNAAALFEGVLVCVYAFLYLPNFLREKSGYILKLVADFIPSMKKTAIELGSSKMPKCPTWICSVDNRFPQYHPTQSSRIALHLKEWEQLRVSAKSAHVCENESNNSIVHVAVSMLLSACSPKACEHHEISLSAVCQCFCCLNKASTTENSSLSTSLISHEVCGPSSPNPRQVLRALLENTRVQLRAIKSPLQQDTRGFSSWSQLLSHVLSTINPFSRNEDNPLAVSSLFTDDLTIQRRALHMRICRINKWHLLLRLHHMPWLRPLRRHALVHPPSQPHLAWRCSTLLLSGDALQAAVTDMSSVIRKLREPEHQALPHVDSLELRMRALDDIVDLHCTMISFMRSERYSSRVAVEERMVGCKCCFSCDNCRKL